MDEETLFKAAWWASFVMSAVFAVLLCCVAWHFIAKFW